MNNLSSNNLISEKRKGRVICVFCGASEGTSPEYMVAARNLAQKFYEHDIRLVYGGGTFGLMGEIAKVLTSLAGPDAVHGIIPAPLIRYECNDFDLNTATSSLLPDSNIYGKTTVVKSMHARKQMMVLEVLSGAPGSGFIALPGGYGTFEELMEVSTWNHLGIIERGIVLFNVEGYWSGLLNWVEDAVKSGFIKTSTSGIIKEAKTAEECIQLLEKYIPVEGRLRLNWGDK